MYTTHVLQIRAALKY